MSDMRAVPMFHKLRRIHMIGIGGSGMSGIAEVLRALGFVVTGSDQRLSQVTDHLASLGIAIHEGHRPEYVRDAQVVVYSSAVKPDNVEVVAATGWKIPVIERSEMLGELTRMKFTIGVAGTHGKTTTTSMIGQILTAAGLMPTIIVGGIAKSLGSGGILGGGQHLVVEADEYARTFLRMFPTVAVVTTLEEDHLDCYRDLADISDTFAQYLARLPFYGVAIMGIDDANVRALVPRVQRSLVTYGTAEDADIRAANPRSHGLRSAFSLVVRGQALGEVEVPVPGLHNARNALAAIAVAMELEVPLDGIREGLARFSGVNRRFQVRGTVDGATVVDDYAHHPTALDATLRTARECWPGKRILLVFQPHLYSRTRDFQREFARVLLRSDVAVVTDVYPSREAPLAGVTSDLILNLSREYGHPRALAAHGLDEATRLVREEMRPGDVVLTVGAGDIWKVATALTSDGEAKA